ncbi:unnamed protein product, partial [Oncorhynchus mykiss]
WSRSCPHPGSLYSSPPGLLCPHSSAPVLYENFYSGQRVPAGPPSSRTAPPITRRGPLPNPDNTEGDVIYSTVDPGYSALQY